jgi:lipoprotein NlpD
VFRTVSWLIVFVLTALFVGCGTAPSRAPVIDRLPSQPTGQIAKPIAKPVLKSGAKEADWRPPTYTVQKGDTLFSIALEHGHDYRDVAEWNSLPPPFVIKIGQVLRLAPPGGEGAVALKLPGMGEAKPLPASAALPTVKTEPKAVKESYSEQALVQMEKGAGKPGAHSKIELAKASPKSLPRAVTETPTDGKGISDKHDDGKNTDEASEDPDKLDWAWPANGRILANFNDNGNSKGLDIAGTMGQPVAAAAAGRVVHTGTTLRGYGKLVIIKHNKSYFSVYAHNSQILVKEGQAVVRGQKIAEMGDSDSDRVKLHFEIRRLGKPTDPLKYLPNDRTS